MRDAHCDIVTTMLQSFLVTRGNQGCVEGHPFDIRWRIVEKLRLKYDIPISSSPRNIETMEIDQISA